MVTIIIIIIIIVIVLITNIIIIITTEKVAVAPIQQDVSKNNLAPQTPTALSKLSINLPFVDLRAPNYGPTFILLNFSHYFSKFDGLLF